MRWPNLGSWVLFGDYADRRASTRGASNGVWDALKVILPASVAAVVSTFEPILKMLDHVPGTARVLRVALPLVLIVIGLHTIVSRTAKKAAAGLPPLNASRAPFEYSFAQPSRTAAKICTPFLLALFMYEVIDVRPNFVLGDALLEGYVCDINGRPVENGVVDAVGSLGKPVSVLEVTTDDTGYFILQIDPWAQRPRSIRLSGVASCQNTVIAISSSFLSDQCPGETRPLPPRERTHVWRPQCTITNEKRP